MQISDRWHSLENATAAFVEGVKQHMGDLHLSIAGGDVDADAISAAEKLQWAGWQRRDEVNGTVRNLHRQGQSSEDDPASCMALRSSPHPPVREHHHGTWRGRQVEPDHGGGHRHGNRSRASRNASDCMR